MFCFTQNPSKSLAHGGELPSESPVVSQDLSLTGGAWVEGRIGGRGGSVIQAVVSLGEAEPGCQRGLFPVLLVFWSGEA